ncbi:uncharacterized protein LOC120776912 [Bactrocera tryoni]|uniref:uncharacterized protein LOC120776912 n=1 Tax=Bactrocera tryoni TaxID=59916 RepID=UPI001A98F17A|nr:uncharacterized protein LOC120776912 [Bactrocera tryoni]
MSLINCKEDSAKTNILMEEGDSSLEPGEVKTPPHGSDSMKPKASEEINTKCGTPQYLPFVKSVSKKDTDKCAEKVRAILELDAIKRKEELERRKEQKSEFLSLQNKNKKKEQKRHKSTKEENKVAATADHIPDRYQDDSIKKTKQKKNIHEDHINSTRHIVESFESMRSIGSAVSMPLLPPLDFVTPTTNVASNFSRGFTGMSNTTNYRSYNPFMRTYRTDFRQRGDDFHKHNRTRFPRYRSQYNSGVFNAPSDESCHSLLQPTIPYSQLLWTKTKPSISYAYNIHDRHSSKNSKKASELNISKKKKNKKSKEREESKSSQSSPKSRRKSSKRKKIRKIRETLQLQPLKNSIFANDEVFSMKIDNSESIISASTENSIRNVSYENPIAESLVPSSLQADTNNEDTNASSKTVNLSKPQILDMFASLTPPKQDSPAIDVKSSSNSSSNIQITNKLQEIQDRIGRLLDDDELKLEVIQATKEKLLKKSLEHIGIGHPKKLSTKKCEGLNLPIGSTSPNGSKAEDKLPRKLSKKRIKEEEFIHGSLTENKLKGKSFDIFEETKVDVGKNTKGDPDYSLDCSDGKTVNNISVNLNSSNFKKKPIENTQFVKRESDKLTSLEDSPCVLSKFVKCVNNGSPDTDDYSDNWENDDDEMDLNSVFPNINQQTSKNVTNIGMESPSSSIMDSAESDSNSKLQSTTPKNSPPPQLCPSPKFSYDYKKNQRPNIICQETKDMQLLYNQFMKSVENADIESDLKSSEKVSISKTNKEKESEQLSTSSTSYSSSSSSSSDSSVSSSGSSSSTSSSDSASEDSNDTDIIKNNDSNTACINEKTSEKITKRRSSDGEKATPLTVSKDDSKPNVARDLKKLENLEANLLRIQMMRANYDSADEISDELLKMEKLFLHEKNIILNKFMDSSANKSVKIEKESHSDLDNNIQPTVDSIQSATCARGQFVQSLQKLPNKDDVPEVSNIFSTNREVIKLTISPVKLPKTSAIFEVDNDMENSKQAIDSLEKNNSTVKLPKPAKEVAIVKPIMETKESTSAHHQKRRRSPIISHHTLQSRSRSRRGRVRSLSVSPSRNSSGRCLSPQRRSGFSKPTRYRNFERRSRSRSPSFSRQISRRSGDISPIPRKRRSLLNIDDRFRKHSPRRDSRSHSRSPCSPPNRHRGGRYSRSPLPFKPPSPPTDPNLSPTVLRRGSFSPERRSRSISRSPSKRITSPSEKSYNSSRHRSLSPKHRLYKQHPPQHSSTSYYFNHSPNRISLDARINIVLNGPSSGNNENNNSIQAYEDYGHYGQYGPAAYMAIPGDSNSFYTNQYVHITNSGASGPPTHAIQQSYPNIRPVGTDESELFSSIQQHVNVNTSNFYYNRFGTQPFGYNQPSPLLKELPKATVAVQKGNVLEIVPCSDLLTGNVAENTQADSENRIKKDSSNEEVIEENSGSNGEKNKRSILKALDGETNSLQTGLVSAPKKKQVNFEDGVFPNHNSDEEDRKVIEAKIRVKMRRLKKKHGITPSCYNLFEDKVRKEKQKGSFNKKDQQPPPPPNGFPPPNLEQPIYLRTHTPTPLLYFHFDGVVHSMYVSQMERPIPPRLLNPKCLTSSSIGIVTHADSQSPLYMQSPITAVAPHLHTSKKDTLATFTRPNRNENLSPKVISSTSALQQTGSPKINLKIYSPIDTEISNVTLPSSSPNSIKGNTIHTISSGPIANHLLPKRQDSPKDAISTRTNISMGLLPLPITHPPMSQNTPITSQTRIPVIGVPPTVVPKVMSATSEPYMPGFPHTMLQNTHPHHSLNQNYTVLPSIAQTNNPHMAIGVQPYFNPPIHRMTRPVPNYMGQQNQPSPSSSNLPISHLVDPIETANSDLDKFTSPQTMAIPFNFKGPGYLILNNLKEMCEKKKYYARQYIVDENIWNSSSSSASEKAAAWRRQLILLEDPEHNLPKSEVYALLQHHYTRLNSNTLDEYKNQRVDSVKSRLKKNNHIPLSMVYKKDNYVFEESDFEPSCSGVYESCKKMEVTDDDLRRLQDSSYREKPESLDNEDVYPRRSALSFGHQQAQPKLIESVEATNNKIAKESLSCRKVNIKGQQQEQPIGENQFRTAREILLTKTIQKANTNDSKSRDNDLKDMLNPPKKAEVPMYFNYGITKKVLGSRRTMKSGFVSAIVKDSTFTMNSSPHLTQSPPLNSTPEGIDERLKNIDSKMVDLIKNEIMHKYKNMDWNDIAGLDYVKSIIKEAVVYPLLRPDIFTGLRRPPRGILLFGPPGTGKTLIGKCIASQSQSTFFSISSSALTSKWVGEGEKMVRALFAVAAVYQPSVVFIDEVDSLLSKRSESEHDSSRKLKNEFLVQLDGASTNDEDRVLIVGATNRPQELDDAARRRFARRLYIPLPEISARIQILKNLLGTVCNDLDESNIQEVGNQTKGYSGADMDILCREASMEPLRSIPPDQIPHIVKDKVRPVNFDDFMSALQSVRPSVSKDDLAQYIEWNKEYGAFRQLK